MRNCFDGVSLRTKKPDPRDDNGKWYHTIAASVGWYLTPKVTGPRDYPLDVNAAEEFLRPKRGIDVFPVPGAYTTADQGAQFMGWVGWALPMNDVAMIEIAMKKRATPGPYVYSDDYVGSFTAIPLAGAPKIA